jgi:phosphoribosylanthranilate isomerase
MKIKICGLKYKYNIRQVAALDVDFLGFIFYPKSTRFVQNELDEKVIKALPKQIKTVAVFVDEQPDFILSTCQKYTFNFVQLHGNESLLLCEKLKNQNIKIIKAFSIDENFDFSSTHAYEPFCQYFIFDTKGEKRGGNGFSFDWTLLQNYKGNTPFLLSGGIGLENVDDVFKLNHSQLAGIDLNSKIEIAPGLKSVGKANTIIQKFKNYNS